MMKGSVQTLFNLLGTETILPESCNLKTKNYVICHFGVTSSQMILELMKQC